MAKKFELPSRSLSRTSISSDSDLSSDLPFPEPLPRASFLTPDFNPQTYLSNLGPRHQTLEDLRSDLHARSQQLSQELLELVNSHYTDFLSLGSSVKGQGEKVEELSVGVMGVKREVEAVRKVVAERETEVEMLLLERKALSREIEQGRALVEWERGIGKLERKLTPQKEEGSESEWSSGAESDEEGLEGQVARLQRRVRQYCELERMAQKRLGREHAFVVGQWERMIKLKNVVLEDARQALRECRRKNDGQGIVNCLACLRELNAGREAIRTLKANR